MLTAARRVAACSALLLSLCGAAWAQPVSSALNYQGELVQSGFPSNGTFDFQFRLFDSAVGLTQIGPTLCSDNLAVSNGRFTVLLDFGSQFTGQRRYLEISVRQDTGQGCGITTGYTVLAPRQELTAVPNAAYALSAGVATSASSAVNATNLNNQPATFYTSATNLTGTLADARLSANVPLKTGNNTFTGNTTFGGVTNFNFPVTVNGSLTFGGSPGLAPFSTTSAVKVLNLNADLFDDLSSSAFGQLAATQTWAGINRFGQLHVDTAGSNNGTFTGNVLRFGAPNSGEGISSNRTTPANGNLFGLDFYTFGTGTRRMSITNAGDVGIGTAEPSAKLDVIGTVRSAGGFVFPDGTTQYRASSAVSTPLVTSGLPAGSTFTITLSGTSATLASAYVIDQPIDSTTTLPTGQRRTHAFHLRRARTTDQQWVNWTVNGSQGLPLTMALSVPGGGSATWSGGVAVASLSLIAIDGVLTEDIEVYPDLGAPLSRTVSGAPTVAAPSTEAPAISFAFNSVPQPRTVAAGSVTGSTQGFDPATGLPSGSHTGPRLQLRTNPFSSQTFYTNLFSTSIPRGDILISGSVYRTSTRAPITQYSLRTADDGLPIEEYSIVMSPN